MPRSASSPYRYDRAAIRCVLEREGLHAALTRWPKGPVLPIARLLGLARPYNNVHCGLTPEQVQRLGQKPDERLAAEWGVPTSTVSKVRRVLGIPHVGRDWRRLNRLRALEQISDRDLMGPLEPLSERVGIAVYHLRGERVRRHIRVSPRGVSQRADLFERRAVAIRALIEQFPAITLQEMAEVFGLTRERVRQLLMVIEANDRHLTDQPTGAHLSRKDNSVVSAFAEGSR